eukprot:TRINITY_DN31715_c0_g1_i1.p1 TRINITY_DN31715_c0_g1~~TRINITY_DN31715_c0_g1_i1.p1  ORF type:complete len:222 (+),score=38.15 TRINITY_DN31715_c0_g1_i1:155-820(+)
MANASRHAQSKIGRLVFGVGNHFYPNSRHSIGLNIVDRVAQRLGLAFVHEPRSLSWVASDGLVALVKPKTYLIEHNAKAYIAAVRHFQVPISQSVVLHHDVDLPVGTVVTRPDRSSTLDSTVQAIADEIELLGLEGVNPQAFPRLPIGVGRPDNEKLQLTWAHIISKGNKDYLQLFLANKFNPEDQKTFDQAIEDHVELIAKSLREYSKNAAERYRRVGAE